MGNCPKYKFFLASDLFFRVSGIMGHLHIGRAALRDCHAILFIFAWRQMFFITGLSLHCMAGGSFTGEHAHIVADDVLAPVPSGHIEISILYLHIIHIAEICAP